MRKNRVGEAQILNEVDALESPPRVIMNHLVFQKIKCFVDLCDHEINGFGTVERIDNDFIVTDVFLVKQRANGMHVEMDPKALNLLIYELAKNGGDPSKIKFQWHSHANGSVFFSGEDIETIAGYMNDFMVSLVMNQQSEYRCRLDLFKPFYLGLEVPLLLWFLRPSDEMVNYCQNEIKRCVKVERSKFDILFLREPLTEDDSQATGTIIVPAEDFLEKPFDQTRGKGDEDDESSETGGYSES